MRERFEFLDGLRGWAALLVMVVHVFFDVFPPVRISSLYLHYWWPFSGRFAVCVFFLISGFALSIGYLRSDDKQVLLRIAAGRYVRLAIPVIAVCAMMSIFLNAGLILPPEERPDRFVSTFAFDPTFTHFLRFAFFDVFFAYSHAETYAGPLWSMSVELIGSMIILALLFFVGRPRDNWIIYFAFMAVFFAFQSYNALFIAGVLCAEGVQIWRTSSRTLVGSSLIIAGSALPLLVPASLKSLMIGTTAFFVGIVLTPWARHFFSNSFSRWLGSISFPLYLVHGPMIFAVGMPIYMESGYQTWLVLLAGIAAAASSFAVAYAFMPINDFAMVLSRWMGQRFVEFLDRMRRPQPSIET